MYDKPEIRISGGDAYQDHRRDFETCPSCGYHMCGEDWEGVVVALILEPRDYHAGCVAISSECPKCFEKSWIHYPMSIFPYKEIWPEGWIEAVEKKEKEILDQAKKDWDESLCKKCKLLNKRSDVLYQAWKSCKIGLGGPAVKECEHFKSKRKK